MAEPGRGRKWLRCGCFGCLGLLVVVLVIIGVMLAVAAMKARSEEVAEDILTPELPVVEALPQGSRESAPDAAVDLPPAPPGRVELTLRHGGFFIEPGDELRVEAQYDRKSCNLEERLLTDEATGWTYKVDFSCGGFSLMGMLKQMMGGQEPVLKLYLPDDTPMSLNLDLMQGGAVIELGGLWLTKMDLFAELGGAEISVSEPLREPMEEMTIFISMSGSEIRSLGNASPELLDVGFKMGGMELDLRGNWLQDSDISIDGRMGGCAVFLPNDVLIEGVDAGGLPSGATPEIKPPTLRFTTTVDQGEIEFID
jgi:hypothetical protein